MLESTHTFGLKLKSILGKMDVSHACTVVLFLWQPPLWLNGILMLWWLHHSDNASAINLAIEYRNTLYTLCNIRFLMISFHLDICVSCLNTVLDCMSISHISNVYILKRHSTYQWTFTYARLYPVTKLHPCQTTDKNTSCNVCNM